MQQSTACLHFAWRIWSGGYVGVAACLACVAAAAVDRQARQSCRVRCAGVKERPVITTMLLVMLVMLMMVVVM